MLKYFFGIFFIAALAFSAPSYAQLSANNNGISLNNADTAYSSENLKFRFLRNDLFYYDSDNFALNPVETSLVPSGYTPSLYMDYYRFQNAGTDNFADIKMSMALRKQIVLNNDLGFVQQFLGIAQTATVGYLAYRHIKKYGFK